MCANLRMYKHCATHQLHPLNPHGPQSLSSPSTGQSERNREKQRGKWLLLRQGYKSLEVISGSWKSYIQIALLPIPKRCPVMTVL